MGVSFNWSHHFVSEEIGIGIRLEDGTIEEHKTKITLVLRRRRNEMQPILKHRHLSKEL
jgi:hypothetical protein